MSSPRSLPDDPRLAEVARQLDQAKSAAAICDPEWRLVWVSSEMTSLLGEEDEGKLGYGKHIVDAYLSDVWCGAITEGTQLEAIANEFPLFLEDTPGGKETLREIVEAAPQYWPGQQSEEGTPEQFLTQLFEQMEPVPSPPVWVGELEFVHKDLPPMRVKELLVKLYDRASDEYLGTMFLYGSALPASVLSFVARGDEDMFTRMTRLVDPGRRQAAILFADLQASAALSRRLASAAYFKLVRALTTAMDQAVVNHGGIVGKHAGDGLTAFFLTDDLGSPSDAARAAIHAGRDLQRAARAAAAEIRDETGVVELDDATINVGVHWGGTLYMGQLVTGGRLEVTALGDAVNECARIQESSRDGELLASKALVERLTDDDARSLGLDPDAVLYQPVSELSGASEKAIRDAGGIPVTPL